VRTEKRRQSHKRNRSERRTEKENRWEQPPKRTKSEGEESTLKATVDGNKKGNTQKEASQPATESNNEKKTPSTRKQGSTVGSRKASSQEQVQMHTYITPAIAPEKTSTKDTSTEKTSTKDISTEKTSTKDISTEKTSTKDISTEKTSTKDISTEKISTKDISTGKTSPNKTLAAPSTIPNSSEILKTTLADEVSLYASEFSDEELQDAFAVAGSLELPLDLFPPVSRKKSPVTNCQSPTVSGILGSVSSTSSGSLLYSPSNQTSGGKVPTYRPTPKGQLDNKLKNIAEAQRKRLVLNVGGRKFETSVPTLLSVPSLLARMIGPHGIKPYSVDNIYTYFLDRNPDYFVWVLNYLRNNGAVTLESLPDQLSTLKNISHEAKFFEIRHLELLCEKKIINIHLGTNDQ
jgi:hypothetical protein